MSPLALFYGAAFGGAILSPILMGLVWICGRLWKIAPERMRILYRTAIVTGPVAVLAVLLAMSRG